MTTNIKIENLNPTLTKSFVMFCCENLDIQPKYVEVVGDKYDKQNGLCIDLDESEFLICVNVHDRNLTQIYTTIAHEMVHVKQYMKDNLGELLHKPKPDYFSRWWEREAREKSLDFVKKFVDILSRIR